MALLGTILLQYRLWVLASAGSFLAATQALSIRALLRTGWPLGVMSPVLSVSPDELVEGTRPINEHNLSSDLNLRMFSSSVNIVMAVTRPMPGMVINSLTNRSYFSVLDKARICLVTLEVLWRKWNRVDK